MIPVDNNEQLQRINQPSLVWNCPDDPRSRRVVWFDVRNLGTIPSDAAHNDAGLSHIPNISVISRSDFTGGPFKLSQLRNASTRYMLLEKDWRSQQCNTGPGIWNGPSVHRAIAELLGFHGNIRSSNPVDRRMNVCFVDGHVESVPLSTVIAPLQQLAAVKASNDFTPFTVTQMDSVDPQRNWGPPPGK